MNRRYIIFYFVIISIFASLLNYLTYPILARVLPDKQFIDITVALSLLTQVSSFLSSIVAISIGLTKDGREEAGQIIEKLQAVLFQLFLAVVLIFLLLSPIVLKSIDLSAVFLIPICLLLLFSIPISIISGYLNGKQLLIKLACAALVSASIQFILTITVGYLSKNGALAMTAMACGQFIAIFVLYSIYKKDRLPHISSIYRYRISDFRQKEMKSLIIFTVVVSIGVMVVNILQILDLLLIQNRPVDAKIYTDLYIISRVVFFAGTIFIWPFLSKIDNGQLKNNIRPLYQLFIILTSMSLFAMAAIVTLGSRITQLLFGREYNDSVIMQLGLLSISYKYLFLLVTALTLYFIVIRSYWSAFIPAILTLVTVAFVVSTDKSTSTLQIISGLNIVGLLGLLLALVIFYRGLSPKRTR